jgi:hypothetical protein
MELPEVKLKLILEIDGVEEVIDSIDFAETVGDLMVAGDLSIDSIKEYVLEVRSKM